MHWKYLIAWVLCTLHYHGKHSAFPSRQLMDFYTISVRECCLCRRRYWVQHPPTWRS